MKYLGLFLYAISSGVFYRVGGEKNYDTKFRDWGVTWVILIFWCSIIQELTTKTWICLILSSLLSWGALSSYFKKKGEDAKGINWTVVGLINGLASIPMAYELNQWGAFWLRVVLLMIIIPVWCTVRSPFERYENGSVTWQEFGRGFWITFTLITFFLWR